jgi:alanyl-tRNA synthetase
MSIEAAKKSGAVMLFGEKYGDEVRVLDIGSSREFCGGTHVARTGDIGFFKVTEQSGVAAGVRRIEATTGEGALRWVQAAEDEKRFVEGFYQSSGEALRKKLLQEREERKNLEKEIARLRSKLASGQGQDIASQAVEVKGVKVLAATVEGADAKTLREALDKLKERLKSAAIVLGAVSDGKVSLIAGVTADLTAKLKAGELVNFVAQQVGGKGGGRPDMAQAGGSEPAGLPAALESVKQWIGERL